MSQRGYGTGSIEALRDGDGKTVFQARWRDAAGRRRQKVVAADRRGAERILADIIRQRDLELQGLKPPQFADVTFEELGARYLAEMAPRVSPGQVEAVRKLVVKAAAALGRPRARDIRREQVVAYRAQLLADGYANTTVNHAVCAIGAVLRYGVRTDQLARNPIEGFEPLPKDRAHEVFPRRAFSDDELRKILDAAVRLDEARSARRAGETTMTNGTKGRDWRPTSESIYLPQAPFLRALAYTGARFAELASTTWGDWSERDRSLTLREETTKTKRRRTIPLVAVVEQDLRRLREIHTEGYGRAPRSDERIFLTPDGHEYLTGRNNAMRFLHDALAEADVPKDDKVRGRATIHSFRHTFCTMLARANAGLAQAQVLMGHKSPLMTAARYTHLEQADLRTAVDKLQVG
jgi:integrase